MLISELFISIDEQVNVGKFSHVKCERQQKSVTTLTRIGKNQHLAMTLSQFVCCKKGQFIVSCKPFGPKKLQKN